MQLAPRTARVRDSHLQPSGGARRREDDNVTHSPMNVIGGSLVEGSSNDVLQVVNPADGSVVSSFRGATAADVDRAVRTAADAQPGWAALTPVERSTALLALAARMHERADDYAAIETQQCGKPIKLSTGFDVPGSIDNIAFYAGTLRHVQGSAATEYDGTHTSYVRRDPVGVVGSIAPWNYPLQMAVWKILPAVAAGNAIVLKPAEITPLTSVMLAEDAAQAGIPDGVINVVTGLGAVAGEALVSHPLVEMVSFTGSTAVGRRVLQLATDGIRRVHMELGGKAPFVVFADADLEAAVHGAVAGSLINSGQDCTAATRAYVHRSLYSEFVAGVADLMRGVRLGDPRDGSTDLGPLISFKQRDRVAGFVDRARADGATIVVGGRRPEGALANGAYYEPTLLTDVTQDSEIVRDEVFGPVLTVMPFDSDDEAIALANDTPFGLAASAWTRDVVRSLRASREIKAGTVWINDHIPIVSEMPHGGFKRSGFGKDMSAYSFEEYTIVKHVSTDITGNARKDWHRTIFGLPTS